ncbi:hypothetical protein ARMGADRAFT_417162 [Armillaria gallica]|uniref:Uncharacterized protein n=1 Tax=Armillaria gallica TaxID=47427 RepID=A0A2H3E4I2_ARMGA|nr:hypothetical protein ARMGADRAFT_417162 [Armillaria gallica]
MSAHTKEYISTAIIFRGTRRQNVPQGSARVYRSFSRLVYFHTAFSNRGLESVGVTFSARRVPLFWTTMWEFLPRHDLCEFVICIILMVTFVWVWPWCLSYRTRVHWKD